MQLTFEQVVMLGYVEQVVKFKNSNRKRSDFEVREHELSTYALLYPYSIILFIPHTISIQYTQIRIIEDATILL